eukprot:c45377_g1_i1.p1 GENE.c45377_g1_i1~~c45377_g1_i1.p1  ORF type:complete len:543 (+),score=103.44 c45377_g1_i1:78-1631(+)
MAHFAEPKVERPRANTDQIPRPPPPKGNRNLSKSVSAIGAKSLRAGQMSIRALQQARADGRQTMLRNAALRKTHATMRADKDIAARMSTATREEQLRMIQEKMLTDKINEHFKGHPPRFTILVTVIQAIVLILTMSFGGADRFGLGTYLTSTTLTSFSGEPFVQNVTRAKNPFFGPPVETLIGWGSTWTPCMRKEEIVSDNLDSSRTTEFDFGCCANQAGQCGMMSESTCTSVNNGNTLNFRGVNQPCADFSLCTAGIVLRPCCFGIEGACALTTKEHCNVISGRFNEDQELCTNNDCIYQQCGMGYNYDHLKMYHPHPNHWFRFFTAMFLHGGVIHFVMNAVGQYVMCSNIEYVAGFWRTAAMYLLSGTGGFMMSTLFSNFPSTGASAAIYGLLGVETVDIFQTWQLIENKPLTLLMLAFKISIFLGIGTLPYIDNFAHVGGFACGLVTAIALLPYISFTKSDGLRKMILQVGAYLGIVAIALGLLYKFYEDRHVGCSWCHYINCVPYVKGMCDVV